MLQYIAYDMHKVLLYSLLFSRWRHQMESFSALLAICAGNSSVTGELPAQRPVMWSLGVFFNLHLNKRLSKHWWGWWFETPLCSLWRHCNDRQFFYWFSAVLFHKHWGSIQLLQHQWCNPVKPLQNTAKHDWNIQWMYWLYFPLMVPWVTKFVLLAFILVFYYWNHMLDHQSWCDSRKDSHTLDWTE